MLLVAVGYLGGTTLPRAWQRLNTDFPNYYVTARLLREGYRTDRVYEWIWLQRQKDHLGITANDQPVVGFVPHTPFSALVVWPLTYWEPLTAKRIWIFVNLALLLVIAGLLQSITAIGWRRVALLAVLNYPLHRNLEYGQYYILLLLIVTLGLWLYLRGRRIAAGILMGIGFGLKIFPVLFLLYFARKRDLRACAGLIIGGGAAFGTSLLAFGPILHRTYLLQVLPWALRGDAMDPYNLSANSISALLHKMFLLEPGWNPHPLVNCPALYTVLHPLLQVAIIAPAIWLVQPKNRSSQQVQMEWSCFLIALLAISTLPASYHFTILVLPVAVLTGILLRERECRCLALVLLLYGAICFPAWGRGLDSGWWALLAVPRLYFVILLCGVSYLMLRNQKLNALAPARWLWLALLSAAVVIQVVGTLHHQRATYSKDREQIPVPADFLMAAEPVVANSSVMFTGMLADGYRNVALKANNTSISRAGTDELSQAASDDRRWAEYVGRKSRIVSADLAQGSVGGLTEVDDAESPVASPDGKYLAYLKSNKGSSRLWLRSLQAKTVDIPLTSAALDVREMTFLPDGSLVVAAARIGMAAELFVVDRSGKLRSFAGAEARYPAASRDGRWLVYSRLERGFWNLWLRDLRNGATHRITNDECNDMSPAWQPNSRTLVFASDCGRALWFTALYRIRVVP